MSLKKETTYVVFFNKELKLPLTVPYLYGYYCL